MNSLLYKYPCDKYPYRIMRANIIFHRINNYCSGRCLMRFSLHSDNFTHISRSQQNGKRKTKGKGKSKTNYHKDKSIRGTVQSYQMRAQAVLYRNIFTIVTTAHFSNSLVHVIPKQNKTTSTIIQDKMLLVSCAERCARAYTSFVYCDVRNVSNESIRSTNIERLFSTNLLITCDVKSFFIVILWCHFFLGISFLGFKSVCCVHCRSGDTL